MVELFINKVLDVKPLIPFIYQKYVNSLTNNIVYQTISFFVKCPAFCSTINE